MFSDFDTTPECVEQSDRRTDRRQMTICNESSDWDQPYTVLWCLQEDEAAVEHGRVWQTAVLLWRHWHSWEHLELLSYTWAQM